MQESHDTINLEYVEVRKLSRLVRLTAVTLSVIFTFTPMNEFIIGLMNPYINECIYGIVGNCGCIIGL